MDKELLAKLEELISLNKEMLSILKGSTPIKKPSLTFEERKKDFKANLFIACKQGDGYLYSNQTMKEFYDYWVEHSVDGKKMRFEMEKVFDIKRRIDTWARNSNKVMPSSNANGFNVGN